MANSHISRVQAQLERESLAPTVRRVLRGSHSHAGPSHATDPAPLSGLPTSHTGASAVNDGVPMVDKTATASLPFPRQRSLTWPAQLQFFVDTLYLARACWGGDATVSVTSGPMRADVDACASRRSDPPPSHSSLSTPPSHSSLSTPDCDGGTNAAVNHTLSSTKDDSSPLLAGLHGDPRPRAWSNAALYEFVTGQPLVGAHDALTDCLATATVLSDPRLFARRAGGRSAYRLADILATASRR